MRKLQSRLKRVDFEHEIRMKTGEATLLGQLALQWPTLGLTLGWANSVAPTGLGVVHLAATRLQWWPSIETHVNGDRTIVILDRELTHWQYE